MKKIRLVVVIVMAIAIAIGGMLVPDQARSQYTSWSQISVQNNTDTTIRFYVDDVVMDDIAPGFFRTYQVKPGYHMLRADGHDGRTISRSIDISPGASPTWTLSTIYY